MNLKKEKITNINNNNIYKITLTNDQNYSVCFYNFGCYFHSISIPYKNNIDQTEDVLLGYKDFESYTLDNSYLNCIVGRTAGRIFNSNFNINGEKYQLFSNEEKNHLHGGQNGFNKKIWNLGEIENYEDEIICYLKYKSNDLEEGYPGNLECSTKYIFNNHNELIIEFKATTDFETIVNLTNHNYWNFHGHNNYYNNIADHTVKLHSNSFYETDKYFIPTGRIVSSDNTKFDFQKNRIIDEQILSDGGIDTFYILDSNNTSIKKAATVYSNKTKMGMDIFCDKPGIVFYTGNMMNTSYLGKYNKNYGTQYGLCLEPQFLTDSKNEENFQNLKLSPEDAYQSKIHIKLANDF